MYENGIYKKKKEKAMESDIKKKLLGANNVR